MRAPGRWRFFTFSRANTSLGPTARIFPNPYTTLEANPTRVVGRRTEPLSRSSSGHRRIYRYVRASNAAAAYLRLSTARISIDGPTECILARDSVTDGKRCSISLVYAGFDRKTNLENRTYGRSTNRYALNEPEPRSVVVNGR